MDKEGNLSQAYRVAKVLVKGEHILKHADVRDDYKLLLL